MMLSDKLVKSLGSHHAETWQSMPCWLHGLTSHSALPGELYCMVYEPQNIAEFLTEFHPKGRGCQDHHMVSEMIQFKHASYPDNRI